jgi:hypothetical protein
MYVVTNCAILNKKFGQIQPYLLYILKYSLTIEPRHDKTNVMRLQPAWIQTSLRIHAV